MASRDASAAAISCASCGESKDPSNARFAHVRLGLDEAPEPVVCKCKPDSVVIDGIVKKMATVHGFAIPNRNMALTQPGDANVNVATIRFMSPDPEVEVELRFSVHMSELLYGSMTAGMFGGVISDTITETGCSWWSGPITNKIAKLRIRSNGEMTAKMPVYVGEFMPGIRLSVSYEFRFEGQIVRPEYVSRMTEQSIDTVIVGVSVKIISRRYVCEDTVSFSSEVEFKPGVTHMHIRLVMIMILNAVGSEASLKRYVEPMYMSEIRHSDHDVVDVGDLNPYKGSVMLKADGMKVYVFCYPNGYIVTFTNSALTIINYTVSHRYEALTEITNKPDVLIAEMMVDGSLVYIDTLSTDGVVVSELREYKSKPVTRFRMPPMTVRRRWGSIRDVPKNMFSSMPSDGVVCVTDFRTLRLKKPTIDLLLSGGMLKMNHNGNKVVVASGGPTMSEGSVYEFTVTRSNIAMQVVISHPVRRLVKAVPNNSDIIRRAFMSVCTDVAMSTTLYDITNMSFKMRARTYEMAQANVATTRKVIVIFGAGRFQELSKMRTSEFSYIAVDPVIDVSSLHKRSRNLRIVPYDMNTNMSKQVAAITNSPGNVLWFKGTSETFVMMRDVMSTMSAMGIPGVFSFSISYHCRVLTMLRDAGVSTFGCGFVHDKMPIGGVGHPPVTMNVIKNNTNTSLVKAVFGKSTYVEPILLMNSVPGLHLIKDALPDLWSAVDSSTVGIMSRAVIMY